MKKNHVIIVIIALIGAIIVYFSTPISAFLIVDSYSDCITKKMNNFSNEINGTLKKGIYENSKQYNSYNEDENICWFEIKYNDTRWGVMRRSIPKKCKKNIENMYPGILAKISFGKIKNGILIDYNDPYGETQPPWRWE